MQHQPYINEVAVFFRWLVFQEEEGRHHKHTQAALAHKHASARRKSCTKMTISGEQQQQQKDRQVDIFRPSISSRILDYATCEKLRFQREHLEETSASVEGMEEGSGVKGFSRKNPGRQ